jgi:outer membrane protein assembly factor BamB
MGGDLCWKQDLGSSVVTRPALLRDRLYVVAIGGKVHCLDAATGAVDWTFDVAAQSGTQPQLLSTPTVVAVEDGAVRVYFGTELKNSVTSAAVLYCLQEVRARTSKRSDQ